MRSWEFFNPTTGEFIEVESPSFDESTHILFSQWEYNPNEWEFVTSYGCDS